MYLRVTLMVFNTRCGRQKRGGGRQFHDVVNILIILYFILSFKPLLIIFVTQISSQNPLTFLYNKIMKISFKIQKHVTKF